MSEIEIAARNVGSARRAGCAHVLTAGAAMDLSPESIWLATTDADSKVPTDWLTTQIASHEVGADVWSGTVTVCDWTHRTDGTADEWLRLYETELEPAHGASLAINGRVYLDAGQFEQLATGEDRALLKAASSLGARCHYDRSAPVRTGARSQARAPLGFTWRAPAGRGAGQAGARRFGHGAPLCVTRSPVGQGSLATSSRSRHLWLATCGSVGWARPSKGEHGDIILGSDRSHSVEQA